MMLCQCCQKVILIFDNQDELTQQILDEWNNEESQELACKYLAQAESEDDKIMLALDIVCNYCSPRCFNLRALT